MPGTVHAIVVVRPDGRTSAAYHLRRTFASLAAGSRRPDAVTLVVCGTDPAVEDALEPGSLPDPTADGRGVRGKEVTPFLLARVSELTHEESRTANVALLENNARVAARIARALVAS